MFSSKDVDALLLRLKLREILPYVLHTESVRFTQEIVSAPISSAQHNDYHSTQHRVLNLQATTETRFLNKNTFLQLLKCLF